MPNLTLYFKKSGDDGYSERKPSGSGTPAITKTFADGSTEDYTTTKYEKFPNYGSGGMDKFESWSYLFSDDDVGWTFQFDFPGDPDDGYTRTWTKDTFLYSSWTGFPTFTWTQWTSESTSSDSLAHDATQNYVVRNGKYDRILYKYTDTANYYDVTWDFDGGTESGDKTTNAAYGSGITRPTVTKIGHTLSWSGNTTVLAETGDDANKQTANWSINSYNITWNPNNGSGTFTTSQEYESQIDTPSGHNEPTWDGYTFNGWTGPDTVGTSGNNRTANWKPKMTLTIGTQSKTLYPNEDTSIVPTIQRLGYTGVWINGTSKLDQGVIIPVLYTTPLTFQIEWTSSEEVSLQNAKKQLNPVNPGEADSNISLKNLQETVNRTSLRKLQERIKIQNWNIADVEYLDVP